MPRWRQRNTTTAIRSYRLYFRDASNSLSPPHEADLSSDDEARELAVLLLGEQVIYQRAEVWDRARLVCTVGKGE